MSSTHKLEDRLPDDFYVTPQRMIKLFLKEFDADTHIIGRLNTGKGIVLDPAAGGSPYVEMSYPSALSGSLTRPVKTMDIRDDSLADIKGDYLETRLDYEPDMIITNPPFLHAMDFIRKALEDVKEGGYVVMLLRLNFLGSIKRSAWLRVNPPAFIYVHSRRPGFFPSKPTKTDSTEYAHFVWKKGMLHTFSQLREIGRASCRERV